MSTKDKKQSTLESFFGKPSAAKAKAKAMTTTTTKAVVEEKENAQNTPKEPAVEKQAAAIDTNDTNADTDQVAKRKTATKKDDSAALAKRRKRVIEDDSSSDEEEMKDNDDNNNEPKEEEAAATELKESPKKTAAVESKAPPVAATKTEEATTDADAKMDEATATATAKKEEPAATTAAPQQQSDLAKSIKTVKSDATILKDTESWSIDNATNDLPYLIFCNTLTQIEATTKRLQIQEILTTLFRQILLKCNDDSDDKTLYTAMYLASNSVAPAYDCVELGIGDAILMKAVAEACGTTSAMVKTKYEEKGDLGSVAMTFKSKQRTLGGFFKSKNPTKKQRLTISTVLQAFREIAKTKGSKSQKTKVDIIKKLLVKSTEAIETKYIIRGLQGKLRIGLAESTVLISLAHSLALTIPKTVVFDGASGSAVAEDAPAETKQYVDKKQTAEKRLEAAVAIVKKAYSEVPSYDAILDAALKVPLQALYTACTLTPGIPVAPMLAKPTKSIQDVLKRLDGLRFTCEYKYDGERAQVHLLPDGTTRVFSRSLLDTSEKYPEVPLFVKEACSKKVQSFVMDAEVVAFNQKTGQLVPFQVLSTRKKTEESAETAKVQVIVQAFDLMFLNGKSLLNNTLAERRKLMRDHFVAVPGKFQYATYLDHKEDGDTAVIEQFLEDAVKGQCEGLMVKTLDVNAIYEPSRRSLNWLKLKKDYLEGLGDSVDLVPLGAYHGKGKRTGFFGAYLLACYDTDTEEFQSVCKIGTGFSEEDLKTLGDHLKNHIIPTKSSQYNVTDQLECDVWFDAVTVWEVKAADLSQSSAHRGAVGRVGEAGRGIGLRFPRFERVRDDKKPAEATSSDQILEMYYQQDSVLATNDEDGNDDDDGI